MHIRSYVKLSTFLSYIFPKHPNHKLLSNDFYQIFFFWRPSRYPIQQSRSTTKRTHSIQETVIYSSRTGSAICIIIEIPFRKEESFEKKASNVTRTRWDGIYNSRNIAVPFFEAKLRARRSAPIFALHVSYYLTVIDISSPRSCYWKFACATHLDRRTTTRVHVSTRVFRPNTRNRVFGFLLHNTRIRWEGKKHRAFLFFFFFFENYTRISLSCMYRVYNVKIFDIFLLKLKEKTFL